MLGDAGDKLLREEKAEDGSHRRLPAIDEFEVDEGLRLISDSVS